MKVRRCAALMFKSSNMSVEHQPAQRDDDVHTDAVGKHTRLVRKKRQPRNDVANHHLEKKKVRNHQVKQKQTDE